MHTAIVPHTAASGLATLLGHNNILNHPRVEGQTGRLTRDASYDQHRADDPMAPIPKALTKGTGPIQWQWPLWDDLLNDFTQSQWPDTVALTKVILPILWH